MRRKILALCFVVGLFSGCGYVPSTAIDYMDRWKDKLYVVTGDASIKILDPKSNRLIKSSQIPVDGKHYVKTSFRDDDHLILQLSKVRGVISRLETQLFLVDERGEVKSSGLVIEDVESLTGVDNNSYYLIRAVPPRGANEGFRYKGVRYDKQTKTQIDGHLEESPELMVVDTWKDETHYWYACLYNLGTNPVPAGQLALVSKSIDGNEYRKYVLGDGHFHDVRITGDKNFVWIFAPYRIIEFSKEEGTFKARKDTAWMFPVRTYGPSEVSDYLWGFEIRIGLFYNTYRIAKANLEIQRLTLKDMKLPDDFNEHVRDYPLFKGFCADEEYIWIGVPLKRIALYQNYVPYILRVSKNDFSSELFLLKPTFGESVQTVSMNLLVDLMVPFRAIFFLIFGTPK